MSTDEDDIPRNPIPRFETVTFSAPTGIPNGWDGELLSKGVPKSLFGRYTAADRLTLLEVPGHGPLVCFGTTMLTNSVCLDPFTGAVLETDYRAIGTGSVESGIHWPLAFVNSSLDQFTASVRAVLDRFPFDRGETVGDSRDSGDEDRHLDELLSDWDQAVTDMAEALRHIDPAAVADEYTFWRTFLDDVQMGDFSAKTLLTDPAE